MSAGWREARAPSRATPPAVLATTLGALGALLAGCGGGAPMMHPAHVLSPGDLSVGAGVSGQLALAHLSTGGTPLDQQNRGSLQNLTVSPGIAPWAAGRVGIVGSNEAGLTYSGRSIRLDARHAFLFGNGGRAAVSVGLGASGLLPQAPSGGNARGVWGGGADLPVLVGIRSTGDLFAFWFGPRAGFEILTGQVQLSDFAGNTPLFDVGGRHFYAGLTAGAHVGFRHVHLVLELNAAYHAASGTFTATSPTGVTPGPQASSSSSVQQLSITPAGALVFRF